MRGFFSFVLLLSLILLLIYSFSYFSPYSFSSDKLILAERIYQLEMNLKENIYEGAKQGALEGLSTYLLTVPEQEFKVSEAKQYIQVAVHEKLSSINSLELEDFEFEIWCGDISKYKMENLRKDILSENKLSICEDCSNLENLNCLEYIYVEFNLETEPGELPELKSLTLGTKKGFFGVSIYSEKFQISSVFQIPKKEVFFNE